MTVAPSFNPLEFPALDTVDVSESTADKPQSKVWEHDDHWWSVLPQSTGSWLWRLDNSTWNPVLQLSENENVHADVKADGNLAHVLLVDSDNTQYRPLQYVPGNEPTYQPWSLQPNLVDVALDGGTETATFDIDSTGRLWLASDVSDAIQVRYADAPYTSFSSPIVVASGITGDDISAVTAFDNNKIGVFWSNQDTERFGFRYHVDGTNPTVWSADEMPVLESMSTSGGGLADDHVNLATASDGTIYAAVKTSFGGSMPQIGLLVRHPSGSWDPLYGVDTGGTRPIVVINEEIERVFVFYVENTSGGDIVYRESDLNNIDFAPKQVFVSGNLNNPSASKDPFTDELLVIASKGSTGFGKLVSLDVGGGGGPGNPENQAPYVDAGLNQTIEKDTALQLLGIVSDDGLPNPPATVTTQWTLVSGPASVDFANANVPQTTVTFDTPGDYQLRLTGNDGEYISTDDLNVTVTAAGNPGGGGPIAGLVGHWTLDAMQGNTLLDASGNQNNGIAQGNPTLDAGVVDQALQLDGSGDFVLVDDDASLDINQEITISAWIKPESKSTQYVVTKADHDKIDGYELSLSGTGKVFARFNQDSAGNDYRVNSSTSYPRDGQTWMHVATTYDGTNIRLYVNGQLETTEAANFQIASNDLGLGIGAEANGSRELKGGVDEVRIYNQALNSAQILSLFNLETPTGEPPVNTAPNANAGANQTVQEGVALQLSGSVSDDGLPNPPANVTTNWTLVSGPGSANFSNANSLQTSVTFNNPGNYVLRLTANDGQYTDSDDVNVQVTSTTPVNQAPQVNAGANRSVEEDTPLQLSGSVSDDGLPNPPANVTTSWTLVSGPGSANFSNASSLQTSVTFNNPGDYLLRLTANDGQYTVNDTLNVTVTAASNPGGGGPIAGLVGHWTLDSLQGDTLVDASGNQNNGTAQGNPELVAGTQNQALRFDGSGDYVLVDDDSSLDITQEITISAWLKPESKSTQYVIKKADHDKVDGYELSLSGGGKIFVRFNQDSAGNAYRVDSTTPYPRDGQTWVHVAATYDGANIRLYVNGQLESTEAANFQIGTNDLDLGIGAEGNGSRSMKGGVDDVRIYNQALSSQEIQALASNQ